MTYQENVREQFNLQSKIDQTIDKSLMSSIRISRLINATDLIGARTLAELEKQGHQLSSIDRDLDTIRAEMRTISKLEKFKLGMSWTRKANEWIPKGGDKWPVISMMGDVVGFATGSCPVVVHDSMKNVREVKIEQNLKAVHVELQKMKGQAIEMGTALNGHISTIEKITGKATAAGMRVDMNNQRIKR